MISLFENFGEMLSTRSLAKEIIIMANNNDIIDFENVSAITPSFAHQFMLEVSTQGKLLKIKNATDRVKKQLQSSLFIIKQNTANPIVDKPTST